MIILMVVEVCLGVGAAGVVVSESPFLAWIGSPWTQSLRARRPKYW
jgi:hypothetical protein